MDDEEQSEEEQTVTQAVTRYVVEINDISCTILYPGTTLSSIAMQYDIPKDKLLEFNEVVATAGSRRSKSPCAIRQAHAANPF